MSRIHSVMSLDSPNAELCRAAPRPQETVRCPSASARTTCYAPKYSEGQNPSADRAGAWTKPQTCRRCGPLLERRHEPSTIARNLPKQRPTTELAGDTRSGRAECCTNPNGLVVFDGYRKPRSSRGRHTQHRTSTKPIYFDGCSRSTKARQTKKAFRGITDNIRTILSVYPRTLQGPSSQANWLFSFEFVRGVSVYPGHDIRTRHVIPVGGCRV